MQSRIFKQMMLLFFVLALIPSVPGTGNRQKRAIPEEKREERRIENIRVTQPDLIFSIQKMIEICRF
jgi:hypothetical protein